MPSWILEYKDILFGGAGVAIITGIVNLIRRRMQSSGRIESTGHRQRAGSHSVNVQGDGPVTVDFSKSIQQSNVPVSLAKPEFSLAEIGLLGRDGIDPEYKFEIYNGGGDAHRVRITSAHFPELPAFPKIASGSKCSFSATLARGVESLDIRISGFDANGMSIGQSFHGIRRSGRIFFDLTAG